MWDSPCEDFGVWGLNSFGEFPDERRRIHQWILLNPRSRARRWQQFVESTFGLGI